MAILADDLTGALDSAEPFARGGAVVRVATSADAARKLPFESCDVIAVNVESRSLAPEAAARAIEQAWRHIAPWRPDLVFKKIDSRLKGNVGAELAALIDVSGRSGAIVAPAIPAIGRVTHGGQVTGFGINQALAVSDLPDWRNEWAIPDCLTAETMADIAKQVFAQRKTAVAAGASGLAEAMAAQLASNWANGAAQSRTAPGGLPMLMVIGSRDPITLEQISVLAQSGIPHATLRGGEPDPFSLPADLVLMLPRDEAQDAEKTAASLADRALNLVSGAGIRTVLLSGGDTAAAFVRLAKIDQLTPLGSLAQGMPISQAEVPGGPLTIISKSGGFGTPDTLVDAFLRWSASERPRWPPQER